jgi:hypothetical protein
MSYAQVIQYLGFGDRLAACAMGQPKLPLVSYVNPAQWYVFPPALVPMASNGSSPGYLGLWAHWFSDRTPSFVSMSVENGRTVSEVARTIDQFAALIVMKAITESDGRTPAIDSFASAMGLADIEALDRLSLIVGDDVSKFSQIPEFESRCPLMACPNPQLYDGEFPVSKHEFVTMDDLPDVCSPFELEPQSRRQLALSPQAPDWWRDVDKRKLFDACMAANNHRGAWLTLNSPGWKVAEVREALTELAIESRAPGLELLRDAWCAMSEGPDLTY